MEKIEKDIYSQFAGMKIPDDIKPLSTLSREGIMSTIERKVDISRTFIISLNCKQFRANEIHIHTADIGVTYKPDFDFSDLLEYDAWRKICKLKYNLQQFVDVDFVRCEGFIHKMNICECLTLFEEIHEMLKIDGELLLSYLDIYKCMQKVIELGTNNIKALYDLEKTIFSSGDSTGIYYNKTILTFDRIKKYLEMAKFTNIQDKTIEKHLNFTSTVLCKK